MPLQRLLVKSGLRGKVRDGRVAPLHRPQNLPSDGAVHGSQVAEVTLPGLLHGVADGLGISAGQGQWTLPDGAY